MKTQTFKHLTITILILTLGLSACGSFGATEEPVTLIYRDWEGAMPEAVLSAFTAKYGIQVELSKHQRSCCLSALKASGSMKKSGTAF